MTAGTGGAPDMKSCKFPCTLAAFLLLGFLGAPLLARSQASATQAQ
jgi:hypothetical protein